MNLSGGIKAWNSQKAVGPEDLGLSLFSGKESPKETLLTAYSLEEGCASSICRWRRRSRPKTRAACSASFPPSKSSTRIAFSASTSEYPARGHSGGIAEKVVAPAMEGGLTTQEYLRLYQPDLEVAAEVISLAMAIEAQALDLYQRAADRAQTDESKRC